MLRERDKEKERERERNIYFCIVKELERGSVCWVIVVDE